MKDKDIINLAIVKSVGNKNRMLDDNLIQMIDFTRHAKYHRAFIVDVSRKQIVASAHVAHGSGSGSRDGLNLTLSNRPRSRQSSPGLMMIAEKYKSMKFKKSYRMDGLEKRNSKVRSRAIVQHTAGYVDISYVQKYKTPGRSFGCPALGHRIFDSWESLGYIKPGRLVYIISKDDL